MDKYLEGWVMLICNPVSGSRLGLSYMSKVHGTLERAGVRHAGHVTAAEGDATRLARAAMLAGCSAVVAIGGDGTLFEVVNGMMSATEPGVPLAPGVPLGLVQAGRGSDFGRSAGIPSDVDTACSRLLLGRTEYIDLGYVQYSSMRGEPRAAYFANAAGLGFDAEVTVRANGAPGVLGGTIPYLSSLLMTLFRYRNKRVTISGAGIPGWHGRANSTVIANGQYFGGGMRIAPNAQLSDGSLDVVILGDLGKLDLVRNVPSVYSGSHVSHPKVRVFRTTALRVSSPERLLLQADGEVLGRAPARFSIFPSVLSLIV